MFPSCHCTRLLSLCGPTMRVSQDMPPWLSLLQLLSPEGSLCCHLLARAVSVLTPKLGPAGLPLPRFSCTWEARPGLCAYLIRGWQSVR